MANIGFIQNELDMKLLVLYIMSHTGEMNIVITLLKFHESLMRDNVTFVIVKSSIHA